MLSVRIWYVWHYAKDNISNWTDKLFPGAHIGLNRLSSYTGTDWPLYYGESLQTSQPIGSGNSVSLSVDSVWAAIRELTQKYPDFKWQYESVDLPIFIFGDTREAFVVDYSSPVYGSDDMLSLEATDSRPTLLEHEIGHTFGLPDHMKPFTNPEYDNCIMGNPYLGQVRFCSECGPRFVRSGYNKAGYQQVAGLLIPSIDFRATGAYAYWVGLSSPQILKPSNTWPANTIVHATFHFSIIGNVPAVVSFEFFGNRSETVVVYPGETGVGEVIVSPLSPGIHQTELVVRIGNAVFREPFQTGAQSVSASSSSIITDPRTETARESISVNVVKQPDLPPPTYFSIQPLIGSVMIVSIMGMMIKVIGRTKWETKYGSYQRVLK